MNNLDNFYNKKLQNREFEFKDSYWEDAEKLIVDDEKKRRFGRYYWLLGLLFIVIIGGSILWIGLPQAEVENAAHSFSNPTIENLATIDESSEQQINQPFKKSTKEENKLSEFNIVNSTAKVSNIVTTNNSKEENVTHKINDSENHTNDLIKNKASKSEIPPAQLSAPSNSVNSSSAGSNFLNNNEDPGFKNDKRLNDKIETKTNAPASKELINANNLAVTLLVPIETVWKYIEEPTYPSLKKENIPKDRKIKLGLTASGLLYPAKNNEKAWIGASLGLMGQYYFLNALSLNAELLYTYRTGTFGNSSKSVQTDYSFGRQTNEFSLQPESMHFLELPIYLQYRIGRHGIEGGLTFSYLAGIYGDIEKQSSLMPWERVDNNKFTTENYSSGWLAKDDFNSFYTSLLIGYRYHVNQGFVIGVRSSYRFGDFLKTTDNPETTLLESGSVLFNVSASWFFLK